MQPTATPARAPLTGISSMATRQLLAELTAAYTARSGQPVAIASVGGVDAAKRVQAGEAFDMVILASDAIAKLVVSGHLRADSVVDWDGKRITGLPEGRTPRIGARATQRVAVHAVRQLPVLVDETALTAKLQLRMLTAGRFDLAAVVEVALARRRQLRGARIVREKKQA